MPLDLNKVKAKLAALQSKGKKTFEKIDYTKIYWKPKVGSQEIRIVPSKYNPEWPFQEVTFHKNIVKNTMYALTNFGEKDPIIEFTAALKAEASKLKKAGKNSDEEWNLAKKLRPKSKTFAQVLVRGEEHLGVRLWEFGPKVYEQLMNIAANEDYANFTDIHEGTDLKVEGVTAEFQGRSYVEPSISPRKKESPLAKNKEDLEKYLSEQHDPLTLYKKYTYEEITTFFEQWLNPDNDGTEDSNDTEELPTEIQSSDEGEVEDEVAEDITIEETETIEEDEVDEIPFVADPPKEEIKAAKKTTTKAKVAEVATKVKTPVTSNKSKFKELFGEKK